MPSYANKIREWLLNKLHITRRPVIRVYNGYGDEDLLLVYGHVLKQSPLPQKKFRKNFWSNTMSLIRLFMVAPSADVTVRMKWGDQDLHATTEADGFFRFEWVSSAPVIPGWHEISVELISGKYEGTVGEGKLLVPYPTQYAFVSDIDDTFLVSHSARLWKRMYVLLTKNARTRRPFEGAVRHYQLLAETNTRPGNPNPFFYVSSSEWNLYDYIVEFKRAYGLPQGVYLLNQIKQGLEFLKTGQTKHTGKFMRIARLLKEFPHQKFILLGDDTQQDPKIYQRIVEGFKDRIICVYLRHVGKAKKQEVIEIAEKVARMGVEVCYFKKSEEAVAHSISIGLIREGKAEEAIKTQA